MRKLILASLISAALVGCGSKNESKKTTSTAQQPAVGSKVRQDPNTCPNLNGTYSNANGSFAIATRIEQGVYQYSLQNSPYSPADGQTRVDGETTIRMSCGQQAVEFYVKENGEEHDIVITDLGNNTIRVDADGKSATATKDAATGPAAPEQPNVGAAGACPVLNGNYASAGGDTVALATQVQGSVYSYKFSADQAAFLPADGVTHQLPNGQGSFLVACQNDGGMPSVSMNVSLQGRDPISIQITDLGGDSLKVKANGQTETLRKQ